MLKVLTGQTIILYYGSGIFSEIYPDRVEECLIVFISVRLFVAGFMTCIADSFGRREFMFYSTVVMFCGMFIAFFGFRFDWKVVAIFGLFTSGTVVGVLFCTKKNPTPMDSIVASLFSCVCVYMCVCERERVCV
jgi:hypothetical protein